MPTLTMVDEFDDGAGCPPAAYQNFVLIENDVLFIGTFNFETG
jgi:hypothetical protein